MTGLYGSLDRSWRPAAVSGVAAALFVDFDNLFRGLGKRDPEAAIRFATNPGAWLERLSTTLTAGGRRRWLVRRCYLNPGGSVTHQDPWGEPIRISFSTYRKAFVREGFQVIDCPPYSGTKNGADITMVIDAMHALSAEAGYQEFVIASGDSDMTPLVHEIRGAGRLATIICPSAAATAYTSVADRVIGPWHLLQLVRGEQIGGDGLDAYRTFRDLVVTGLNRADRPLHMAALAERVRKVLGGVVEDSDWFGSGDFRRAVERLGVPGLRTSQHHLWDATRHRAPAVQDAAEEDVLPGPVERLAEAFRLPRLSRESWLRVYRVLAEHTRIRREPFDLGQCTSWSRDRLEEQGHPIGRDRVAFVARAALRGGCLLDCQQVGADEVARAVAAGVLAYACEQGVVLGEQEALVVRAWLGAGTAADAADATGAVDGGDGGDVPAGDPGLSAAVPAGAWVPPA